MNILFVTGKMLPKPSANSIIAQYLVNELVERGHNIKIISLYQDNNDCCSYYNSVPIYSVKTTLYSKYMQKLKEGNINLKEKLLLAILFVIRRINNTFNILRFPDVDPHQSKKAYLLARKLHLMEPFDIVIGIFRPFSAISTTIQLKDDFPELVAGAYYLDLISGSNKPKLISKYLYDYLCKRGERRAFSKLDFILMAKEGENIYGRNIYSSVNKIINYVDFPMFVKTNVCNSNSIRTNSNETIFIYAGTLDKNYRNPSYMLELLGHLGIKIPNLTLHIFGKGDCSSIINKYRNYSSFSIIEHGFVEHEEVISAMKSADFIINIANTTENIVPSKIFELFSMGKPILNFVKNERDTSLKYFNKYPSAKIIKEWDKIENQMEAIQEFVVHEKDKIYTFEQIRDNFLENTPRHIVDKIEGVVERLSQLESKLSNSSTKLEQK